MLDRCVVFLYTVDSSNRDTEKEYDLKIEIPTDKGKTLVFKDNEQYSIAVGAKQHGWYEVSLVDHKGTVTELCRIDKADVKRLAKAS